MIIAGSSLVVTPVAGLPIDVLDNGGNIIIINNMSTYLDERAAVLIMDDVASAIPAIAQEVIHGNQ